MSESRPDWVLLRGLTREARHWGGFPERLGAALGVEVHCLDLPGNGHLLSEAGGELRARLVDWVPAVFDGHRRRGRD